MARGAKRETRRERRHERRHERLVQEREVRRSRGRPEWVVPALGVIFLLSGSAGLVHEVVWTRLLGHVFGATSLAVSTVLAAFMGGLALGSWWIGTRSSRVSDRRGLYARLEIGIGVAALLVPLALQGVEPIYGALWRRFHPSFAVFGFLRFLVAASILLAPTVMMGATLPVLADYLASLRGRRLAPQWLYTANLVGAVLGVAAAGFLLMPTVGIWGTILAGAVLNIAIGLVVLMLPELPDEAGARPAAPVAWRPRPLLLVAAFLSGLLSFATQVAWTRVLVLVVGSTAYAFSSVLLAYLIALGAGSAWASRRGARLADVGPELGAMHLLMAICLIAAVYVVDRVPYWYASLWEAWAPSGLPGIVLMNTTIVFALLFPSVLFAGTILPLVLVGARPPAERGTGAAVGGVYAVNTIGAVVGAVVTGFFLIPHLGSETTLLGVAVVGAAMGVVFCLVGPRSIRRTTGALVAAALVVGGVGVRPRWKPMALNSGVFEGGAKGAKALLTRRGRLLFHREGQTATIVVSQWSDGRQLTINGRVNASDLATDMLTQVMMAQVPLLLAPRTDDVFLIGWGSGVTAGSVLQSPVKRVHAVELEPAVVEASRRFQHVNRHPLVDRRLRLYEDDARHVLLADRQEYDVIISEPSHPWVTGVSNLFTQDFFTLAARRLRPDGVFAQWLQTYQIPVEGFRSILATFQSVFPETLVFVPSLQGDTILLGSRVPLRIDVDELARRWARRKSRVETARVDLASPEHFLARFFLGPEEVRRFARGATINTDNNMYIELQAPRNMVRGDPDAPRVLEALRDHPVPVEALVTDSTALLGRRERLAPLVKAVSEMGRPDAAVYRERLKALPD